MNNSADNSLRHFENMERQLAAAMTAQDGSFVSINEAAEREQRRREEAGEQEENEPPLSAKAVRKLAEEEDQQLRQERLEQFVNSGNVNGEQQQQRTPLTATNVNGNGRRGGNGAQERDNHQVRIGSANSEEPAETIEDEQSAAAATNFRNNNKMANSPRGGGGGGKLLTSDDHLFPGSSIESNSSSSQQQSPIRYHPLLQQQQQPPTSSRMTMGGSRVPFDNNNNSLRQFENMERQLAATANSTAHDVSGSSRTKTPTTISPLPVPNFRQPLLPSPQQPGAQNRPMFQSTPQQRAGGMTAVGGGKRWPNLPVHTPGGRPVSPIAEERDAELNRLVGDVVDKLGNGGGGTGTTKVDDKLVRSLATQLRDVIAQWDWAQARHRHVSKIVAYFERQQEELNAGWEQLQAEMAKQKQQHQDEWARIAGIRSGLQAERAKVAARKDEQRVEELEAELKKLKAKDLLSSRTLSELRTRVKELEGEVRMREDTFNEHLAELRKNQHRLVQVEKTNCDLRTKLTLIRAAEEERRKQQEEQQQQQQNAARSAANGLSQQQQQQQVPGPRRTLFGLFNPERQQQNRIASSTSSSMGAAGSSTSTAPAQHQQTFMRRNNSDNGACGARTGGGTFVRYGNGNGSNNNQMHRSNSETIGSGNGGQSASAPRPGPKVRFADDQQRQQQEQQFAPVFASVTSPPPDGSENNEMSALNARFDIPADMVNTMYRWTNRGKEYTFTDGQQQRVLVTELLGCRQPPLGRQCLLYEYPQADGHGLRNFLWVSGPATVPQAGIFRENHRQIKIEYSHEEALYLVHTALGHRIRFLLTGQLEVCWLSGDRTVVLPDGERREIYRPAQPDFCMEIYLPTGIAYRLDASTNWQREEFVPDTAHMASRPDGSYSTMIGELLNASQPQRQQENLSAENLVSLQINGPDFKLRRFNGTQAVKLALDEPGSSGNSEIQCWLCVDNVLLVKHVQGGGGSGDLATTANGSGRQQQQREKRVCFAHGQCRHIRTNVPSSANAAATAVPMITLE